MLGSSMHLLPTRQPCMVISAPASICITGEALQAVTPPILGVGNPRV